MCWHHLSGDGKGNRAVSSTSATVYPKVTKTIRSYSRNHWTMQMNKLGRKRCSGMQRRWNEKAESNARWPTDRHNADTENTTATLTLSTVDVSEINSHYLRANWAWNAAIKHHRNITFNQSINQSIIKTNLHTVWPVVYKKTRMFRTTMHGDGESWESQLTQGSNYKKILRLSYDVIIAYDNRKLLSHRKMNTPRDIVIVYCY